jgi:hypothetical protein
MKKTGALRGVAIAFVCLGYLLGVVTYHALEFVITGAVMRWILISLCLSAGLFFGWLYRHRTALAFTRRSDWANAVFAFVVIVCASVPYILNSLILRRRRIWCICGTPPRRSSSSLKSARPNTSV